MNFDYENGFVSMGDLVKIRAITNLGEVLPISFVRIAPTTYQFNGVCNVSLNHVLGQALFGKAIPDTVYCHLEGKEVYVELLEKVDTTNLVMPDDLVTLSIDSQSPELALVLEQEPNSAFDMISVVTLNQSLAQALLFQPLYQWLSFQDEKGVTKSVMVLDKLNLMKEMAQTRGRKSN